MCENKTISATSQTSFSEVAAEFGVGLGAVDGSQRECDPAEETRMIPTLKCSKNDRLKDEDVIGH